MVTVTVLKEQFGVSRASSLWWAYGTSDCSARRLKRRYSTVSATYNEPFSARLGSESDLRVGDDQ